VTVSDGDNGRDAMGQFAPGNKFGKGNPMLKKVAAWRRALRSAVTGKDIKEVVAALLAEAKSGDVPAARELLDRCLGRPAQQQPDEQAFAFELPPIECAEDLPAASRALFSAAASGRIPPGQMLLLSNLLEQHRRSFELIDVVGRLRELEELKHHLEN